MPPEILEIKPRTDGTEPLKPKKKWYSAWRRYLFVLGCLAILSVIGYAASFALQRPKPPPKRTISTVNAANLSKITAPALPDSQLTVTELTAQNTVLANLLAKALQVTTNLNVQGTATVVGGLAAGTLSGSGAGVTGVDASLLDGEPSSYFNSLASNAAASAVSQFQLSAALLAFPNTFTANNTFDGTTSVANLVLNTPLSDKYGGTGLASVPVDSVLYGQGGPAMGVATPGGTGLCLISGAGSDLWGPCTGGSAVFSLDGVNGPLTLASSTAAGTTVTINPATTTTTGLASFNATNFSVSLGAVDTIQDIDVAATPTFGGLNLTSALTVPNGGTGAATLAANGLLLGNGTSPVTSITAGVAGECLISSAGAPTFQACPGAGGVTSLNGLSGTLSVADAAGVGSTITIQDASTTEPGLTQFNGTNFTVAAGVANTIQNIDTTASPTFAAVNTNNISPTGALTVGTGTNNVTLQGANTTITATSGATTSQLTFQAPTANVTYVLQTAASGTYDVCTTAGNCGDATTAGGLTNDIAKYTSTSGLGPSELSDNGTLVSDTGNLSVAGTLTLTNALTVGNGGTGATTAGAARTSLGAAGSGANSDITSLSALSTALTVLQGGTGATTLTADGVLIGNGTSPVSSVATASAGLCLVSNSSGNAPSWQSCSGSGGGVTTLDGLSGPLTIADSSGGGSAVTIQNASTSQLGIAEFNSTNFTTALGIVNTAQDISTSASPTFGQLTLTSSQAAADMFLVNNTNGSPTGNLLNLETGGVSQFKVGPAGNVTGGTYNGAAITGGSLTATSVNGLGLTSGSIDTASPGSLTIGSANAAITLGNNSSALTLQGNASTILTASGGGFTTSVGFSGSPTASQTYNFDRTALAGTYTICTTSGNCLGGSSGGANAALSNLSGVAINTSLLPGVSNSVDAGSQALLFRTGYFATALQAPLLETASTNAPSTNSANLAISSGSASGTTSSSGNVTIDTGSSTSTAGSITIGGINASSVTLGGGGATVGLAGNTSITGTNTFTVTSGSTTLGGTLGVTGQSTLTGALTVNSAALVNANSTSALTVQQTGVHNNTLVVDTTNADVGIDRAPMVGQALAVSGNIADTGITQASSLQISSGASGNNLEKNYLVGTGGVTAGDVVVLVNDGGISDVTDTQTSHDTRIMGVALNTVAANGTNVDPIVIGGNTQVTADTGAVSIGDILVTSTTSGEVTVDDNATTGILGYATSAKSAGASGLVGVYVRPEGGVSNPNIPGNLTVGGTLAIQGAGNSTISGALGVTGLATLSGGATVGGTLATNTITPTGSLLIGATGQSFTLQGNSSSTITSTSGSDITTVGFSGTPTGNVNYNFDTSAAPGTYNICTTTGNCASVGGGVTTSGGTTGTIPIFTGSQTIGNSVLSQSGSAVTLGGNLLIASSQALSDMLDVNNLNSAGTGNLINLEKNGTSEFSVTPSGNLATAGTIISGNINGQTITSAANFTGSVVVGTTLTANNISPTAAFSAGSTGQSFTLQGNASSVITATGGGFATTLGFSGTPTGAVSYNFDSSAAPGTYTVCTTVGNCSSSGGGVTTPGGTIGALPVFTGSQTLGNSLISESGTTVSLGTATTLNNSGALTITGGSTLTLNSTGTSDVSLDSGSTGNVNIGTGGNTKTIDIGTSGGSGTWTQTTKIGNTTDTSGTTNVTIGSTTNSADTITSEGGATSEVIGNSGATLQTSTNTMTAFQIQDAGNGALLNVDTTDNLVTSNSGVASQLGNNSSGNWSSTTPLGGVRDKGTPVAVNGYLYYIGGNTTTTYYGKVNNDGTVSSWGTTTALPITTDGPLVVEANNYIYVIGGYTTGYVSTVYYAHVNADGTLGSWQTSSNSLTGTGQSIYNQGVVANGYIYVIGGYSGSALGTVYYAKLHSDGTIGAWTTSSNSLVSVNSGGSVVVANGYIYLMGGNSPSDYEKAQLNSDGSTSAWTKVATATSLFTSNAAFVADGNVYVVGGYNGTNCIASIEAAALSNSGTLGTFATVYSSLPVGRCYSQTAVVNGYIYYIGGTTTDDATAQTTAYYISLPRTEIAGSLDLVGLNGDNLANSGSGSLGDAAGSLSAGNTNIVGTLQVQDAASFNQQVSVNGSLSATSDATFADTSNSSTAFQVQNAMGVNELAVGTSAPINYIVDPDFTLATGGSPTDWSATGGATVTQNTTPANTYEGSTSLELVTTGAGQGFTTSSFTSTPPTTNGGYYTVSFYAETNSGNYTLGNNIQVAATGGGSPTCTAALTDTGTSINANGFRLLSCNLAFTSSGSISSLTITDNNASGNTLYIDGVQLQTAASSSSAPSPFQLGTTQLRGVVTSPVAIQDSSNSSNAFAVYNASNTPTFAVNTADGSVGIDQLPANGAQLTVGGTTQSGAYIVSSGNSGNYIAKNYTVGTGGISQYDVLVAANDSSAYHVIDTTISHDPRVIGVATTTSLSGNVSPIAIAGNFQVTATSAAVNIGDQLVTSGTSGQVMTDNNATTGIVGYATTAKAGGLSGVVGVTIHISGGVNNPVVPGDLSVEATAGLTNSSTSLTVNTGAAGNTGILVQAASGQTSNIETNEDSNGVTLSGIDANGDYNGVGTTTKLGALQKPAFSTAPTGTSYYYVMTATNAEGETLPSPSIGMANDTSALNWTQIAGATGYKIYRNTSNSFTTGSLLLTTISNGATLTYTDTGSATTAGLPPTLVNTLDSLVVTNGSGVNSFTVNAYGSSTFSNGLAVTGQYGPGTFQLTQTSGTIGEIIKANGAGNAFQLQDSNGDNLGGYSSAADYSSYGTNNSYLDLAVPSTPTITTGASGTSYYYVVTATNAQGETMPSGSVGLTSDSGITIAWTQVPGATGYMVYRNTTNSFTSGSLLVQTIANGSTTTFSDSSDVASAGFPPTAPTGTGLTLQGWSGQTASLLQLQNAASTSVFSVDASGDIATIGTTSINTNSTTALVVQQTGVHNNVLSVDTTNGAVGIDTAPTVGNALTLNGNIADTGTSEASSFLIFDGSTTAGNQMKSYTAGTGGVAQHDVVVLANDSSVSHAIDTTTSHDTRVMGVATSTQTSGNLVNIAIGGNYQVTASTGAVNIGDMLVTSTTSGQVMSDDNATTGILGYATTSKLSGSSGLVGVYIRPVGGVNTPTIPGTVTLSGTSGTNVSPGTSTINATGPGAGSLATETLNTGVASNQGLVLQGTSSQTGNLLTNEDVNGITLSSFDANGNLNAQGTKTIVGALKWPNTPTLTLQAGGTLTSATTYWYAVTAVNAQGETIANTAASKTTSSGNQQILVSWNQIAGATGYNVYRNTSNSFTSGSLLLASITNGVTTSFTDSGAATTAGLPPVNELQNYFVDQNYAGLCAICTNGWGNVSMTTGLAVSGATGTSNQKGSIVVTQGSGARGVVLVGNGAFNTLDFQDNFNDDLGGFDANGQAISYGTNMNHLNLAVPTFNAPTLGASGTLSSGQTYYYVMTATNAQGQTTASSSVNATPSGGNLEVNLTWTQVSGATGYKIYRNTSNSFTSGSLLLTVIAGSSGSNGTTTSYTDTGTATSSGLPPASVTGTTMTLQGWNAQTGNVLQLQNAASSNVAAFDTSGDLTLTGAVSGATSYNGIALTSSSIAPAAAGVLSVSSNGANTLTLDTGGAAAINIGTSNANAVNIANNASAHTIAVGTGAAVQGITIGSSTTTSQTTIEGGSSGTLGSPSIAIGNGATNHVIAIGENSLSANSVYLGSSDTSSSVIGNAGAFNETLSNSGLQLTDTSDSATAFSVVDSSTNQALTVSTSGNSTGWNSANATMDVAENSTTLRSINAAGTINASGADYAEYFPQSVPGALQPGQLVCLTAQQTADTCSTTNQGTLIGAVSSHPGYVGNDIFNPKDPSATVLVGLMGQVEVQVSTVNGPIAPGDSLTISPTDGVAEKATTPGMTIGQALESYDASGTGEINVYLHVGYYSPTDASIDQPVADNYLQNGDDVNFSSLNVTGATTLASLMVTGDATISGQLTVGSLTVNSDLTVNGHIIAGGSTPTIASGVAACSSPTVSIAGTDTAGVITVTTGTACTQAGALATVSFSKPYQQMPEVVLTPANISSTNLKYYLGATSTTSFTLKSGSSPTPDTTYVYNYLAVQ